jgi:TonB family protein
VREVRHSLADSEPERAEEVLRQGMQLLPGDPVLAELQQELTDSKRFREEWRAAQVSFGRREFQKAEMILVQLAGHNRPEVDLLLLKVREARAACDEGEFYTQGREKAVKLIQQQKIEQAADLLRNLLTLFPGDPILQRDLQSIQSETDDSLPAVHSQAHPETSDPISHGREAGPLAAAEAAARPILICYQSEPTPPFLRSRLAVIVAAVVLLAASSSAALWRFSRHIRTAVPAKVKPSPMPKEPVNAPDPLRTGASIDRPPAGHSSAKPGTNRVAAQTLRPSDVGPHPGPRPDLAATPERVDGRMEPAMLMKEIRPVIPALARQQNLSGIVDLEATVDAEGKVTTVRVLSGHSALVSAARDAVMKWRYRPAILNGEPIETKVNVQVVFDKVALDSGTGRQSESR